MLKYQYDTKVFNALKKVIDNYDSGTHSSIPMDELKDLHKNGVIINLKQGVFCIENKNTKKKYWLKHTDQIHEKDNSGANEFLRKSGLPACRQAVLNEGDNSNFFSITITEEVGQASDIDGNDYRPSSATLPDLIEYRSKHWWQAKKSRTTELSTVSLRDSLANLYLGLEDSCVANLGLRVPLLADAKAGNRGLLQFDYIGFNGKIDFKVKKENDKKTATLVLRNTEYRNINYSDIDIILIALNPHGSKTGRISIVDVENSFMRQKFSDMKLNDMPTDIKRLIVSGFLLSAPAEIYAKQDNLGGIENIMKETRLSEPSFKERAIKNSKTLRSMNNFFCNQWIDQWDNYMKNPEYRRWIEKFNNITTANKDHAFSYMKNPEAIDSLKVRDRYESIAKIENIGRGY